MRVRIYAGPSWSAAIEHGDYEFDLLPAIGHKLALAAGQAWDVAVVRDIAHRIVDPAEAPDIALLMTPPVAGGSMDEPLPLALLDRNPGAASASSIPRTASLWASGS
ncbi:hypothetical protein [Sphingomonas glacialis]|uniref:Uncharacterized protein n=1 Tax=Sphingomonas glacialis TaxID=658225 RepID=A0A502FY26_9SPHN|nr:hypothetical protein [Sphingomonas glacialis]TPG54240.1 hypothetical protein EAH76_06020 [Sphingomonas glacialis]